LAKTTKTVKKAVKAVKKVKKAVAKKPAVKKTVRKTTARQFALAAAKIGKERHCTDITVLDLKGLSPVTDYYVILTGTSDRQMKSIADEISVMAREKKYSRFGMAGYQQAHWILLDYVDVVIHIMNAEAREYYNLEMLWGDAKKVK
jgi:ribosome-associated protein